MKYTKDNVIGLEVIHQDRFNKYRIISVHGNHITTIRLSHSDIVDDTWATVDDVNRWLENGIWSLLTFNYEIY